MNSSVHIDRSSQAASLLKDLISRLDHEELWGLFLTQENRLIAAEMLTKGSLSATIIDVRTILRRSLLNNASKVLVAHNHPPGNPAPSLNDIAQTRKIQSACSILDIPLVDHIILAEDSFFSFSDEATRSYQPLNI